jgi:DNA-binding transcriptional MocR family regulator
MNYLKSSKKDLEKELAKLLNLYKDFKEKKMCLDISRGKPSPEQLALSEKILEFGADVIQKYSPDPRNYGCPEGLVEARILMSVLLGCEANEVIIGGNSSLSMMFDAVSFFFTHGGWDKNSKFLCLVPGYDRHFAICEYFGIEMISIPIDKDGQVSVEIIKNHVENNEEIKGMWCVPKHSNPSGIIFSTEIIQSLVNLKPAASNFRIFWDNAYAVHDFEGTEIVRIFDKIRGSINEDLVIGFSSTSKITFAGGGIAAMACLGSNMKRLKEYYSFKTIGFDKINQARHAEFFSGKDKLEVLSKIKAHMKKHAEILVPKFNVVTDIFEKNFSDNPIISWNNPKGGYFINARLKCSARQTVRMCAGAGLKLTAAGAMCPYGIDPEDSMVRIAPSYPCLEELRRAAELFCVCVKISYLKSFLQIEY